MKLINKLLILTALSNTLVANDYTLNWNFPQAGVKLLTDQSQTTCVDQDENVVYNSYRYLDINDNQVKCSNENSVVISNDSININDVNGSYGTSMGWSDPQFYTYDNFIEGDPTDAGYPTMYTILPNGGSLANVNLMLYFEIDDTNVSCQIGSIDVVDVLETDRAAAVYTCFGIFTDDIGVSYEGRFLYDENDPSNWWAPLGNSYAPVTDVSAGTVSNGVFWVLNASYGYSLSRDNLPDFSPITDHITPKEHGMVMGTKCENVGSDLPGYDMLIYQDGDDDKNISAIFIKSQVVGKPLN
jgi:hypothetical protein